MKVLSGQWVILWKYFKMAKNVFPTTCLRYCKKTDIRFLQLWFWSRSLCVCTFVVMILNLLDFWCYIFCCIGWIYGTWHIQWLNACHVDVAKEFSRRFTANHNVTLLLVLHLLHYNIWWFWYLWFQICSWHVSPYCFDFWL